MGDGCVCAACGSREYLQTWGSVAFSCTYAATRVKWYHTHTNLRKVPPQTHPKKLKPLFLYFPVWARLCGIVTDGLLKQLDTGCVWQLQGHSHCSEGSSLQLLHYYVLNCLLCICTHVLLALNWELLNWPKHVRWLHGSRILAWSIDGITQCFKLLFENSASFFWHLVHISCCSSPLYSLHLNAVWGCQELQWSQPTSKEGKVYHRPSDWWRLCVWSTHLQFALDCYLYIFVERQVQKYVCRYVHVRMCVCLFQGTVHTCLIV